MDRIDHALDFIEAHLARPLSLPQIAAAACYSPYHFARFFRARTGWSVMAYVQARRLTLAADRLRSEQPRLLDLALDSGFDSQAAFTRAFKRKFDLSPGAFRATGCANKAWLQSRTARLQLAPMEIKVMQTPRFTDYPAFRAVGLKRSYDDMNGADIPALWDRFNAVADRIPHAVPDRAYGICLPPSKPDGKVDYYAALAVEKIGDLDEQFAVIDVPAQYCAVFTHCITQPNINTDLMPLMRFIWEAWLPNAGYDYTGGPDFELYDHRFEAEGPSGEFDIYIPVRAK